MIGLLAGIFIKDHKNTTNARVRHAYGILCGAVGVFLNALLFAIKLTAGLLSGSVAIIADAFNNLSDAGSSVVAIVGFKMAGQKPDPEHPFGHGRIEYITGLIISMLVILMGAELVQSSVSKIIHPESVVLTAAVTVILLVSIVVKLYMYYYNSKTARLISSAAMKAVALDSFTDSLATLVVLAAASPTDCFKMAFQAARLAIEHMTPVILLTDAFIANGSSAWRIPEEGEYPVIKPNYVPDAVKPTWTPFMRNALGIRYWAIPGTPGLEHVVGGLEKDYNLGVLSNDPINHAHMVETRRMKIANIANDIPELKLKGDTGADTIILGWGSTYGHILDAVNRLNDEGIRIAMTHIRYINPLPKNTAELLSRFKTVIVAELNNGQLAAYLQSKVPNLNICHINKVQGQPFQVQEIVDGVKNIMMEEEL